MKGETNMEQNDKAEHDYAHHKQNPGPSKEALEEKSDKPASRLLQWVIIIAIVVLTIIIFWHYY